MKCRVHSQNLSQKCHTCVMNTGQEWVNIYVCVCVCQWVEILCIYASNRIINANNSVIQTRQWEPIPRLSYRNTYRICPMLLHCIWLSHRQLSGSPHATPIYIWDFKLISAFPSENPLSEYFSERNCIFPPPHHFGILTSCELLRNMWKCST